MALWMMGHDGVPVRQLSRHNHYCPGDPPSDAISLQENRQRGHVMDNLLIALYGLSHGLPSYRDFSRGAKGEFYPPELCLKWLNDKINFNFNRCT